MAGIQEKRTLYVTAATQLMVVTIGAVVASLVGDPDYGISFLWGGGVALANTALLTWRLARGDRPADNAHQHLRLMYRSSLERFFVVTMLLVLGMLQLGLKPLLLLLGFLVGQLVLIVVPIMRGLKVK